ncbi:SLH domain-containing protein OS=Lysinibacillus sphaericus OX=1421 GN=LS41612_04965 PE=4 SV=1 [Lysinibacillus sphaericus]
MKKTILAGALSIACFTGGFATQAQAQGNDNIANIIHPNQVVVATNQAQSMSYQDIYKMLLLSELGIDNPDNMTVVTTKNSITLKISLKAVMDSYSDGSNLYPEGEKEFKENYEEIKKLFGDAMQMRFIQSGNSYKAEVYAEGKWQTASNKDVNDWLTVLNRADFELL